MKMRELLQPSAIFFDFDAVDKEDALKKLAKAFSTLYPAVKKDALLKGLVQREALGSTGLGSGIALPHVALREVDKPKCLLAISKKGVAFNSLDGEPVHIFLLIIYPEGDVEVRIKVLARVARLLRDKYVQKLIVKATSPEQIVEIFEVNEMVTGL